MIFTTYLFVFYFLPLVLVSYYAGYGLCRWKETTDRRTCLALNGMLALAGYLFLASWYSWCLLLVVGITLLAYVCGRRIASARAGGRLQGWAVVSVVVVSLGTLGFFKWFFFEAGLHQLTTWFGPTAARVLAITLPIGISISTLHAVSYAIDIGRGIAPPVRSFLDLACYLVLFPQLLAGPIIRYHTAADQLASRGITWRKLASGAALFALGFAKEILLANPLGRAAHAAFAAQALSAPDAWFGALACALQVYLEFSGYSDMAVGLGRMFGFDLPKNFDSPYMATSITDFWRRWNISLNLFFRDYLYIPLGGNRGGSRRTYLNLMLVMLVGGLWYGASWMCIVWAAYHGLLLVFDRWQRNRGVYQQWPRPICVATTFMLVLISWVLFRSASPGEALRYLGVMIGQGESAFGMLLMPALLYTQETLLVMALAILVVVWPIQAHEWSREMTWPRAILVPPIFCVSLLAMLSQSSTEFLGFRF